MIRIPEVSAARPVIIPQAVAVVLALVLHGLLPLGFIISPAQAEPTSRLKTSMFVTLNGRWTGWGWIKLASGDRERIKCRISYRLIDAGNKAAQGIRCASTSYNIDATALLWNIDGIISGNWNETTYNARGRLSGTASENTVSVKLISDNLNAVMKINPIGKCRQTVSIKPEGVDIKMISVGLKRC